MKFENIILVGVWMLIGAVVAFATTVTISPNMGMPVPVVGSTPGPEWANDINASLSIIDSHDHSAGHGVQITPDGLDINSDLDFGSNNATALRSTRFTAQSAPLSDPADLGALYVSGADLYYNDEAGNQVRITTGGNVNAGAGSITGLPSGTASASFAASTFTFQSATSTPAIMAVGPVKIGTNTASSKTVTLAPPGGLAANYDLTFPNGLPGSTSFLDADVSGNMAFVGSTGSGSVVLATSPTIASPTISGTATFSGVIADPLTLSGSHATGNGTRFNILNTNTSQELTLISGSGSVDPSITVVSNDDLVFNTNNLEHFRLSKVGDTTQTGAHATGNGTTFTLLNSTTSHQMNIISGSSTVEPSITVVTNDDLIVNTNNAEHFRVLKGGGVTVTGAGVTITGTGGNTPHTCTRRSSNTTSTTVTVTCSANEIVVGGGGICNGTVNALNQSYPDTTASWTIFCAGGSQNLTAYAICCLQ